MYKVLLAGLLAVAAWAQPYADYGDQQLAAYIKEAVDKNPSVRASFARYRASLQKIPQVTALPDPMLNLTPFIRSPETRVGPQNFGVSLSQKLPWFGKLSEKGKVALKEAEYQARLHEADKANIARQVKLAYFDLAYVDQTVAITREEIDLLTGFERLAAARYSQGVGLQQGVVKLQLEITRLQNRMEQLRSRRVDAEAAINTLMDRPPIQRLPRAVNAERPRVALNPQALTEQARKLSPEMQAAFDQIEKQEKRVHAARKEYWPDFTLGVGYVNVTGRNDPQGRLVPPPDNGKDVWNVSVGVNLPIGRRRRDAAVLEATEAMIASKHTYRGRQNSIEAAIRTLSFRLETIEDQVKLFEGTLLPQAEQALRASEAAYSTGAVSVLDLLDSQRMLLDIRLGLASLNADYMKALANLERAVGSPLPEVNS
jgi:outer membrane protein, heavy metal efflux system